MPAEEGSWHSSLFAGTAPVFPLSVTFDSYLHSAIKYIQYVCYLKNSK
jgi:hypothetical protein